jgi:hypothetical protein
VFDQIVSTIEEAWDVIGGFECPEDFTGCVEIVFASVVRACFCFCLQELTMMHWLIDCVCSGVKTVCAIAKNVGFVIATVALFVSRRVLGAMENSYPAMSEYEKYEMFQHAVKVVDNMKILNHGVDQLKRQ